MGTGLRVYRWNDEKILAWLSDRIDKLKAFFADRDFLHSAILKDGRTAPPNPALRVPHPRGAESALERYSCGFLADFLRPALGLRLKARLGIKEPLSASQPNASASTSPPPAVPTSSLPLPASFALHTLAFLGRSE